MEDSHLHVSEKFSKGFGNLALKSSDGVICYFPSALLCFMSPIFQETLNLGNAKEKRGEPSDEMLQIAEPIAILELFLTHINPKMAKPPIDKEKIEALLVMGHKYRVDMIMQWFDLEASTRRSIRGTTPLDEFAVAQPCLALSLASRYGLNDTARVALWELSGCHNQKLLDGSSNFDLVTYLEVTRLRDLRIKYYHSRIDILAKVRPYDEGKHYQMEPYKYFINNIWYVACTECIAKREEWMLGMIHAIQLEPSWTSFIRAYEADSMHCIVWGELFRYLIPTWREEAMEEESKLPAWPIGRT